jgi:hypothetical protein
MILLLLLLIIALILALIAAMVLTARALLDLQQRDITPFLAPTLASSDRENQYLPAGLWHVHCLAATYHDSSDGSEE